MQTLLAMALPLEAVLLKVVMEMGLDQEVTHTLVQLVPRMVVLSTTRMAPVG